MTKCVLAYTETGSEMFKRCYHSNHWASKVSCCAIKGYGLICPVSCDSDSQGLFHFILLCLIACTDL